MEDVQNSVPVAERVLVGEVLQVRVFVMPVSKVR